MMKIKLLFVLSLASLSFGQEVINGGLTVLGPVDHSAAPSTMPFASGLASAIPAICTIGQMYFAIDGINGRQVQKCSATNTWNPVGYDQGTLAARLPTCGVGQIYFRTDATAGQNLDMCTAPDTWVQQLNTGGSVNQAPGCTFDGGGATIALNTICYTRVRVACALSSSYQIIAMGSSPTATINVLKVGAGTLLPTSSIIASSVPTLTIGNAVVDAMVLTAATVNIDDILAFKVTAVSNATWLDISLKCN